MLGDLGSEMGLRGNTWKAIGNSEKKVVEEMGGKKGKKWVRKSGRCRERKELGKVCKKGKHTMGKGKGWEEVRREENRRRAEENNETGRKVRE